MPPRGQGPRLWLRTERRDDRGRISHPAVWLIRDGGHQESTRCGADDREGAEKHLGNYLARKHVDHATTGQRRADQIPIADVLAVYSRDVAPGHADPYLTSIFVNALLDFFGERDLVLSQLNGAMCRRYAAQRSSDASARRELEVLRAAINHYHREGFVREKIAVSLPVKRPARERWLQRAEAARLLMAAWRYREQSHMGGPSRHTRRHVARFIIVGLYTGRRSSAIMQAALQPMPGRGHIDLQRGVFHPAPRLRASKKHQPPIQLPRRLIAHIRRWKKAGQSYVVEWLGEPIKRIGKAFRANAKDCGFTDVTPHTIRHTAATWLMQRAAEPWAASGYLGMSLETLVRTYGHHHPDHLKAAWSVFDRPGGVPKPKPKPNRRPARALKRKSRPRRALKRRRRA